MPLVIDNGELVLPTGPGWGVEINLGIHRDLAGPLIVDNTLLMSGGGFADVANRRISGSQRANDPNVGGRSAHPGCQQIGVR